MAIVFSKHAKQQLARRKISQRQVLQTMNMPEKNIYSYRNRKLRQRVFSGKLLQVVTKTEGLRIIVITAYFLEEKV